MSKCFLHGYGRCRGKITGEHYISRAVLDLLSDGGGVEIGGLPWLPHQTMKKIGIASLVSNMLCEEHNSGLSNLDNEAGKLFRALDAADKQPATLPPITEVTGKIIERWLIKVLCGLVAAAGFNNGIIPEEWKRLLVGSSWPAKWGLYVPNPLGRSVLAREFYLETCVRAETKEIKAAKFRIAGVHFTLMLGRPDDPAVWGKYRPRGLIFDYPDKSEKRVELKWPTKTDDAIIYTKVGVGGSDVPQWEGWKKGK